jgi:autotransporter-associated beta strand protein
LPSAAQSDPSAAPPAPIGGYYTADGQRTADYAAALDSWRNDKQFGVDYSKGFLGLEYAYVLGLSGKGQTIGINDVGVRFDHPLFSGDGKITGLHTNVSADYGNDGHVNPRIPWLTHGTHTAGTAAGNRLTDGTMFGAAYGANIIAATTNFAEGDFLWWRDAFFSDTTPDTSIHNINDLANTGKARIISNSWGSSWGVPYDAPGPQFRRWYRDDLGGLFNPVLKNDALVVFAAGNGFGAQASPQALVPLSDERLRSNWLSVANYSADGTGHYSTSLCGQSATWCVAGPGADIVSGLTYMGMDTDGVAAKYSDALYAPMFAATDFNQLVDATFSAWETALLDYVHRKAAAQAAGTPFDEDAERSDVARKAVGITMAFGAAIGGDPDALVQTMSYLIAIPGIISREAETLDEDFSRDVLTRVSALMQADTKQFVHVSDPTYGRMTGTSMAAPAVAGFAAVLMEAFPNYNTGLISDILVSSAKDLDDPGVDLKSGWGVPQMGVALRGPTALRQTRQVDVPEGRTDVWSNGIQDARDRYAPAVLEGFPDDIGGIVKRGGGQLILSGANSYSGETRVEEGLLTVDGRLSRSALTAIGSGIVGGTGTLAALTAADGGAVSPGDAGQIGTLTVAGPATLAAGSRYIVDIGANGTSDLLVADQVTLDGGTITLRPAGAVPRFGNRYDVVKAGGGIAGTFGTVTPLSAILYPEIGYTDTLVTARIAALPYASVVAATPVQTAFARLLDANRTAYSRLSDVYVPLDVQSAPTIQATLESLAPRTESTRRAIGTVASETLSRFYRDRTRTLAADRFEGGSIAMIGKPIEFAANAVALPGRAATVSDTSETTIRSGVLPENVSVYLAGGYVDGSSAAVPGTGPAWRRDRFDGFYVATGIETQVSDTAALGFGFSYAKLDGKPQSGRSAKGELIQGTLYGRVGGTRGASLDTQVSAGVYQSTTRRNGDYVGLPYALRAADDALSLSSEIGGSYGFGSDTITFGPRVSLRASRIAFTPTAETGTGPALVTARDHYDSLQSRVGLQVEGDAKGLRPFASFAYVHDFQAHPDRVLVGFADGTPLRVPFSTLARGRDWGELGSGIAYRARNATVSFATDGTIGRHDVQSRTYRAGLTLAF